ncbi:TPA: tail fiber assembly protein [Escherichia coli]|uniref:tail fiber assembly protein n=1 Tax=Escherichia coli TaxID=562 RepID=UPI000DA4F803|nr:tail fiber assembly protein [Escherichia coli]SQX85897.1 CPS-53 (KpLE1) prophage protein [Escherichia coli]HCK0707664.1 tail fiber assembly protein [Escherichia coli]HCN4471038.1 tail fiber assembly protein [Escherichia coli]HCQ0072194.1 tail fiber assembly protein [Escherichia coli]
MGETDYIFSAFLNGFLPLAWKEEKEATGSWPDDAIEISYEDYLKFTTDAPEGKILGSVGGRPAWIDIPPPTAEEQANAVTLKKQALINEANTVIAPLKDALDGEYIDDEDKPRLTAWQKYRYALTKVDPAKPAWPAKPE